MIILSQPCTLDVWKNRIEFLHQSYFDDIVGKTTSNVYPRFLCIRDAISKCLNYTQKVFFFCWCTYISFYSQKQKEYTRNCDAFWTKGCTISKWKTYYWLKLTKKSIQDIAQAQDGLEIHQEWNGHTGLGHFI